MVANIPGARHGLGLPAERVHSINTSWAQVRLVYPGLGWVVWRKKEYARGG